MTELCLQVYPHRSPELDIPALISECERLSVENRLISRFWHNDGFDQHAYLNLAFETGCPKFLWHLLSERLYGAGALGQLLSASSIVTCQGQSGWDDYLLLHHYDAEQRYDAFP
ncbi:hypothetical protein ACQR16_10990 [Bradyrhizobium oligotrophicum]|uniref:hypothetical protein n=1 Tax=Bradyrhizobium oligotrophicum TaxID=44255 RepID=UPI003EB92DC2